MIDAYMALGSNLGDRLQYLSAAKRHLQADAGIFELRASPIFETAPEHNLPHPHYLNAVVGFRTSHTARALLATCLGIEAKLGRKRPPDGAPAPRPIDLDLLLYGQASISEKGLRVPHPALLHRPFVRIPLAAVATPGLVHPVTGDPLDRANDAAEVALFVRDWPAP